MAPSTEEEAIVIVSKRTLDLQSSVDCCLNLVGLGPNDFLGHFAVLNDERRRQELDLVPL